MTLRLLALAVAIGLLALPASSQVFSAQEDPGPAVSGLVDATDPESIAALLREEGYKATLKHQESGAVEIQSSAHEASFWLYFQACTPEFTECEVITFSSGFDFETAQLPDIIGDWNVSRFSKAYLDKDGDPFVEFSINMKEGVSRENFLDTLSWFTTEMEAFIERIGWNNDIAGQTQPI